MQLPLGGVVLGCVPTLAAVGWALMRVSPDGDEVESFGVIRTRVAYGTSEQNAAGDVNRRSRSIASLLRVIGAREVLTAIVRRAPDPKGDPHDGRVYGILDVLAVALDVPVLEVHGVEVRAAREATRAWLDAEEPGWTEELADDEIGVALYPRALDAIGVVRVAAGYSAARSPVDLTPDAPA